MQGSGKIFSRTSLFMYHGSWQQWYTHSHDLQIKELGVNSIDQTTFYSFWLNHETKDGKHLIVRCEAFETILLQFPPSIIACTYLIKLSKLDTPRSTSKAHNVCPLLKLRSHLRHIHEPCSIASFALVDGKQSKPFYYNSDHHLLHALT